MNAPTATPESCPRYQSCSANICPLDPDWRKRSHLQGEPVCGLLRELVKPNGAATLATTTAADLVTVITDALPEISARNFDIRAQLARSAKTGSRIKAMQRTRGAVGAQKGTDQQERMPEPAPTHAQGGQARQDPQRRPELRGMVGSVNDKAAHVAVQARSGTRAPVARVDQGVAPAMPET